MRSIARRAAAVAATTVLAVAAGIAVAAPAAAELAVADYQIYALPNSQVEAFIDVHCLPMLPTGHLRFRLAGKLFLSTSFICPASGEISFCETRHMEAALHPGEIVALEFDTAQEGSALREQDRFYDEYVLL